MKNYTYTHTHAHIFSMDYNLELIDFIKIYLYKLWYNKFYIARRYWKLIHHSFLNLWGLHGWNSAQTNVNKKQSSEKWLERKLGKRKEYPSLMWPTETNTHNITLIFFSPRRLFPLPAAFDRSCYPFFFEGMTTRRPKTFPQAVQKNMTTQKWQRRESVWKVENLWDSVTINALDCTEPCDFTLQKWLRFNLATFSLKTWSCSQFRLEEASRIVNSYNHVI